MIRGPSRGLGTFRCRCCRWILLIPLLFSVILLFGQLQPSEASALSLDSLDSSHPHRHHRHRQQQQQQIAQTFGGYKESTEEGSILRLLSKNNLYIQSFPNGTVSATVHDSGYYSVLTQGAVGFGRIYILGVASRMYLCINKCGRLYGSEKLEPDCILRDQMEDNWYNTYTSIIHSTAEKSLYMAFNSNTGSPCRLRLKSERKSDGRSLVSLGSHEKYALFFPVRNISLPDGMTLTSLMKLGKRIPFEKNNLKPTGCAPRCSKLSDQQQSIKPETSSTNRANKEKSKRKKKKKNNSSSSSSNNSNNNNNNNKCSCLLPLSTETPTTTQQGAPCRRPCRPTTERLLPLRNAKRISTTTTTTTEKSREDTQQVKWSVLDSQRSSDSKTTGKKKSDTKKRAKNTTSTEPTLSSNQESGGRLNPIRDDSRLIRHRYRKIRAHPELAQQLEAMSDPTV